MNNVIVAVWLKGQSFNEPPQILYAYWMVYDGKDLVLFPHEGPKVIMPLDNIGYVSVVGQFDKGGTEYRHHDDKGVAALMEV